MKTGRIFVGVILLGAAAFMACHREEAYQRPLTPVSVRAVELYSGAGGVRYSGNVEPLAEVELAFKVGGYIEDVRQERGVDGRPRNLQEGDVVAKGTLLARVRERDYADKVNQAKAQLSQAQVAAEKAKLDFDRASTLFASQSLTKPDFDGARAQLDSSNAAVEGARAQLAEAETALADCSLRAPMDGVVLKRAIELGSFVGPGTVAFSLADTSSIKVVFGVPDIVLASLRTGQVLAVTTQALRGRNFRGRIDTISPSADPRSRVFDIELLVPNPGNQLKPGMIAALELPGESLPEPLPVVPLAAIVRPKEEPAAYAVAVVEDQGDKQVAHIRKIELGQAYGNTITVAKGIQRGERVIVVGATLVADGEQVRVIP